MLAKYIKNYNIFYHIPCIPHIFHICSTKAFERHTRQATKPALGYLNARKGIEVLYIREISSKRTSKKKPLFKNTAT